MTAVVQADGLGKTYHARRHPVVAVADVSFTVEPGRTLALVGESGAGKSTVASILTGTTAASAGTVRVCGEDRSVPARSTRHRRRRGKQLQLVAQDPYTSLDLTQRIGSIITEALTIAGIGSRSTRPARALELLQAVGLGERHLTLTPRALSGGQRQRVSIARALAAEPEVIVLDEAVSALDVSVQAQVLNLLRDLQTRTGTAYIFITHDLAVVRQIAHEVLVLQHGRTVEHGPVDQVLDTPQDAYTRMLLASTPRPGWRPVARAELLVPAEPTSTPDHRGDSR